MAELTTRNPLADIVRIAGAQHLPNVPNLLDILVVCCHSFGRRVIDHIPDACIHVCAQLDNHVGDHRCECGEIDVRTEDQAVAG